MVVSGEALVQVLLNRKRSSRVIIIFTRNIPMLQLPCNATISVGLDDVARLVLVVVVVVGVGVMVAVL